MDAIKAETIGGFNAYLDTLEREAGDIVEFTWLQFDSVSIDKLCVGARLADVLLQQASIHLDQKQYDLSLRELQQSLQIEPQNASAHYLLSLAYYDQDNDDLALQEAQQAVALDRYLFGAYLHLAFTQLDLDDTREAIRAASRAAALAPYADVPHFVLGMAYLQEGQDHSAAVELQKFLDLYQGYPSEQDMKDTAEKALKRLNPTL